MIVVALSMLALAGSVGVKVTHGHLRPICLDGEATRQDEKSWHLSPGPHSMVFTMRNGKVTKFQEFLNATALNAAF